VTPTLTTRDIVTIAILAALGGALSTFVGYLGNLINLGLGVPFGAGQFLAGIHVFWLVLMRVIIPRHGVGTAGGLLKGTVELFTGSTHGIVIVLVSLIQGILIDIGAGLGGNPNQEHSDPRFVWSISAGIASASNVWVFQLLYFSDVPLAYLVVMTVLAFSSGVIFAGYFAWETLQFLNESGVIASSFFRSASPNISKLGVVRRNIPAAAFVLFLVLGSSYYILGVARFSTDIHSCKISGLVENPYVFRPSDFESQEITIEAQLSGSYITLPPANYTGILLSAVISEAVPASEVTHVRIIARDGYSALLEFNAIMSDTHLILTDTDEGLWLIAGAYEGSQWVRMVSLIEIY
jgi:ABC-type thiamin/hydroxymethylpyrimidine transport system permease subunit